MSSREERLWARACTIRDACGHGFWVPIFQHLALRGHALSMVALADWQAEPYATRLGDVADPFSACGLYRRAWRQGDATAAHNLAMSFFARRDLANYRLWLQRAARAGDDDAALPHRRFETRRPHANARRIGRIRPFAKRDDFG